MTAWKRVCVLAALLIAVGSFVSRSDGPTTEAYGVLDPFLLQAAEAHNCNNKTCVWIQGPNVWQCWDYLLYSCTLVNPSTCNSHGPHDELECGF